MLPVGREHSLEPVSHFQKLIQVEARITVRAREGHCQRLDCRLGRSESEWSQARIDDVETRLYGLQGAHGSHSTRVVRVKLERYVEILLERRDQGVGIVWGHEPGHVLDAYAVGAQLLEAEGLLDVVFEVVDGAAEPALFGDRVADRQLQVLSALTHGIHRSLQVALVVQRVEHAEYVDADLRGLPHESPDNVVGVVPVAHEGLAPQQHHQRRVGHEFLETAEAVPRVFP